MKGKGKFTLIRCNKSTN